MAFIAAIVSAFQVRLYVSWTMLSFALLPQASDCTGWLQHMTLTHLSLLSGCAA